MKKIITAFLLFIFITSIITFIGFSTKSNENSFDNNQNKNQKENFDFTLINPVTKVIHEKHNLFNFKTIKLFGFQNNVSSDSYSSSFVTTASTLHLKRDVLNKILNERQENITFEIPISENENMELEITKVETQSNDFILTSKTNNGDKLESYEKGLHYNGIIKGKEKSIASISIFKNFVMGIISDENGNYVLGSIKNDDNSFSDKYIFYNDKDLIIKNKFKCNVDDYEEKFVKAIDDAKNDLSDNPSRLQIKIYFEADYQLYLDAGSNLQTVADFINGFFNSVKTIYQNESIPLVISQIGVWTVPDAYANLDDSYFILKRFGGNNQDDFQGNLAHLISTRQEGLGGIAWIRILCSPYNLQDSSGRYGFSNINPNYNNYPTYSWTINVVTHELGHNLGSRHTHACVWPIGTGGAIRAIDSCFTAKGGCFGQTNPRFGTIMSYCHLWFGSGGGVNLSLGFGPLPGDTIRLRYAQAHCLDQLLNSSERPSGFDLAQNFPNPFNPSTTIRFALPKESFVTLKIYDINGRLIADLIQNKFYDAGFYDYQFNSSQYSLSSGIYFYKLDTKEFNEVKRMVLVK